MRPLLSNPSANQQEKKNLKLIKKHEKTNIIILNNTYTSFFLFLFVN